MSICNCARKLQILLQLKQTCFSHFLVTIFYEACALKCIIYFLLSANYFILAFENSCTHGLKLLQDFQIKVKQLALSTCCERNYAILLVFSLLGETYEFIPPSFVSSLNWKILATYWQIRYCLLVYSLIRDQDVYPCTWFSVQSSLFAYMDRVYSTFSIT